MKSVVVFGALSLAALWGCGQTHALHAEARASHDMHEEERDEAEDGEEEGQPVALADVPRAVLDAAARAVPDATWLSAVVEVEHGRTLYELYGSAGGEAVEVEITAAGEVLEVERE